jgi:hypothetical protein
MSALIYYLIKNKYVTDVVYLHTVIKNQQMEADISFSCLLNKIYKLKIVDNIVISHTKSIINCLDKTNKHTY